MPLVTVREGILRQIWPDLICLFDGEQIEKMIFILLTEEQDGDY